MRRLFIYFLSISFLLTMNGFHIMIAEAKEKGLPIGDMVSRGTVKFEARENIWKNVESSHFPIFQGVKVKTENGMASVSLSNGGMIEAKPNSLFFFTHEHQLTLSQGGVEFRIPSGLDLNFRVGKVSISKARALQASSSPLSNAPIHEETIGSINLHSNGALTIKTIKGKLTVFDENQVVLASVNPNESITIPSSIIRTSPRTMVAQLGETTGAGETEGFLGLSTWTWVGIGVVVLAVGAGVGIGLSQRDKDHDWIPLCP